MSRAAKVILFVLILTSVIVFLSWIGSCAEETSVAPEEETTEETVSPEETEPVTTPGPVVQYPSDKLPETGGPS